MKKLTSFCLWGITLLLGWTSMAVMAQTETLRLSVDSYNERVKAFSTVMGRGGVSYFDVTLEVLAGGTQQEGDLYFGAITPDGNTVSWVENDAGASWESGLVPLVTDLNLGKPLLYNLEEQQGRAQYIFGAEDAPLGMYSIFALLVNAGADPNDTRNWLEVEMKPFIVASPPPPSLLVLESGADPSEMADAEIIFTSSKDTAAVLATTQDLLLEGSIKPVSGSVPRAIIVPADTLIGGLKAGVSVRMYLKKFPDRDAYYPIYIGALN